MHYDYHKEQILNNENRLFSLKFTKLPILSASCTSQFNLSEIGGDSSSQSENEMELKAIQEETLPFEDD